MSTTLQRARFGWIVKKRRTRAPALCGCPQKLAVCSKVTTVAPKKPNSADRKIAKVEIRKPKKKVDVYLPGVGHTVVSFSVLLVRGGRVKDLPGMKYKAIRGVRDFAGVVGRRRARSKYGVSNSAMQAHEKQSKISESV
jgi:small subunit ribosomal protein S12